MCFCFYPGFEFGNKFRFEFALGLIRIKISIVKFPEQLFFKLWLWFKSVFGFELNYHSNMFVLKFKFGFWFNYKLNSVSHFYSNSDSDSGSDSDSDYVIIDKPPIYLFFLMQHFSNLIWKMFFRNVFFWSSNENVIIFILHCWIHLRVRNRIRIRIRFLAWYMFGSNFNTYLNNT